LVVVERGALAVGLRVEQHAGLAGRGAGARERLDEERGLLAPGVAARVHDDVAADRRSTDGADREQLRDALGDAGARPARDRLARALALPLDPLGRDLRVRLQRSEGVGDLDAVQRLGRLTGRAGTRVQLLD